MKPAF